MTEDLASQWKRRNKIVQERNSNESGNKNHSQEKSFDYQILETKPKRKISKLSNPKTIQMLSTSSMQDQDFKQHETTSYHASNNKTYSRSQQHNNNFSSNQNTSYSSQYSSSQSSSQQSSHSSRQVSPSFRSKSPVFQNHQSKSSFFNKKVIIIYIFFFLGILSLSAFVYYDTCRFCNENNGKTGVDGCKTCPKFSENCSFYSFDCDSNYYQKYDGFCVPFEYVEEFRDLRDDLHRNKEISLSAFIENRDSQIIRDSTKVLNALKHCDDIIIDNDRIVLIEPKRNFSFLFLSLAFFTSIIVFTIVNYPL